jgi:site-specific recombinase XerD
VGIETRRALVKYRYEIDAQDDMPLFQTIHGKRFTESGLRSWLTRLSNHVGVHITPHALRRTFATMALKAGMDLIRLQQLMGHADLDTTRQYIQVLDVDLIEAYRNHSPIEFVLKGKNKG